MSLITRKNAQDRLSTVQKKGERQDIETKKERSGDYRIYRQVLFDLGADFCIGGSANNLRSLSGWAQRFIVVWLVFQRAVCRRVYVRIEILENTWTGAFFLSDPRNERETNRISTSRNFHFDFHPSFGRLH